MSLKVPFYVYHDIATFKLKKFFNFETGVRILAVSNFCIASNEVILVPFSDIASIGMKNRYYDLFTLYPNFLAFCVRIILCETKNSVWFYPDRCPTVFFFKLNKFSAFLVGAFINKRARLYYSHSFFSFFFKTDSKLRTLKLTFKIFN